VQAKVGWGRFLKGFIATDLQSMVNTQKETPQNTFEQMQWTCETIQWMWDLEAEHWKCCNGDKHGTTPVETDQKKQEKLLMQAQELLQTKHQLPPRYKKMFPSYAKLNKNQTRNLETWSIPQNKQSTIYSTLTTKQMMTPIMTHSRIHPTTQTPLTPPSKVCPHQQVMKQAKSHQISLPRQQIVR
jgi:hypothetical protein